MTIGEAAQKYDLSVDTLRYYERIGLIPPVPRTQSGLRDYDEESCSWVEFIKCMRNAGVAVEALIEYVALFRQGERAPGSSGSSFSWNSARGCAAAFMRWNRLCSGWMPK